MLLVPTFIPVSNCWYLAKSTFYRHLRFTLIRVRNLVITLVHLFIRFLKTKGVNAFERLPFDSDLVLVYKVRICAAAWGA